MWRRLWLGIGFGVPLGALALVTVVTGAFVGANLVQIIAFHVPCLGTGPVIPWIGIACGTGLAGAVPFVAAGLGFVLLIPYAGLLRRWIGGRPPLVGWYGIWLVGRALAGCYVGLSALAGGSWLYIQLNNRYLHFGCTPPPPTRTDWLCEGNIYYGIHPLVAIFTIALLVMYPVLWNSAAYGVDPDRPGVRNGGVPDRS